MREFKELRITGLNKYYGNKKVVDNFNLTIKNGEFVTLLGPSGSGKSTVLNCIAGLIPIDGGSIYIDDECLDDGKNFVPPEKRNFGMVFQNYALFPHLSVFDNVAFGLRLRKLPKDVIKEKVISALRMVHLEEHVNKYPRQLSGGEQQRVALARCIVMEPRVMLLDEPLSNLDALLRIEMRYELKALHERLKITTIYVTHDQQEALALSDRIVVLNKGKIQQIGTPEEIYSYPSNLFVANFLGFRNIWEVKILKLEGDNVAYIKFGSVNLKATLQDKYKSHIRNIFENNKRAYISVRPEDIEIGEGLENNIEIKIEVIEYLGHHKQFWGVTSDGINIEVSKESNISLEPGDSVKIWIPPERILIFSEED
ncbi:MAG: ABC transporter ATP-binding protein [Dictyoglomus thermophilum]